MPDGSKLPGRTGLAKPDVLFEGPCKLSFASPNRLRMFSQTAVSPSAHPAPASSSVQRATARECGGEARQGGKGVQGWRRFLVPSLIVLASFAVRWAALKYWGTGAIEAEGAAYARIAENLRKGTGYVGIMSSGLDLNTPPLLPLLISAVSFVTRDYVRAGRLVTFVLGAFLPLPVFGVALRLFGRRTALVAAALAILYPLLINLSVAVLGEGPYPTLLLSAVFLVLGALKRPSTAMWCGVGAAFGLT